MCSRWSRKTAKVQIEETNHPGLVCAVEPEGGREGIGRRATTCWVGIRRRLCRPVHGIGSDKRVSGPQSGGLMHVFVLQGNANPDSQLECEPQASRYPYQCGLWRPYPEPTMMGMIATARVGPYGFGESGKRRPAKAAGWKPEGPVGSLRGPPRDAVAVGYSGLAGHAPLSQSREEKNRRDQGSRPDSLPVSGKATTRRQRNPATPTTRPRESTKPPTLGAQRGHPRALVLVPSGRRRPVLLGFGSR